MQVNWGVCGNLQRIHGLLNDNSLLNYLGPILFGYIWYWIQLISKETLTITLASIIEPQNNIFSSTRRDWVVKIMINVLIDFWSHSQLTLNTSGSLGRNYGSPLGYCLDFLSPQTLALNFSTKISKVSAVAAAGITTPVITFLLSLYLVKRWAQRFKIRESLREYRFSAHSFKMQAEIWHIV